MISHRDDAPIDQVDLADGYWNHGLDVQEIANQVTVFEVGVVLKRRPPVP